jgi:hypothetical protein
LRTASFIIEIVNMGSGSSHEAPGYYHSNNAARTPATMTPPAQAGSQTKKFKSPIVLGGGRRRQRGITVWKSGGGHGDHSNLNGSRGGFGGGGGGGFSSSNF